MKTISDFASTFQLTNTDNFQNNKRFQNPFNISNAVVTQKPPAQQLDTYQTSKGRQDQNQVDLEQKIIQIQQNYLLQEIQTHRSLNIQKHFPSRLKQLAQRSTSFLNLQTQLSSLKSLISSEQKQLESVTSDLSSEIAQLESHLFQLQNQELSQSEYQKSLLLGLLESFEIRMKNLLLEKQEKSLEKQQIVREKDKLQSKIKQEKDMIIKLSIMKEKLLQDLKYTQNCELGPILMTKQKHLKQFESKSKIFHQKYLQNITQTISPHYTHLNVQEHNFLSQTISGEPIQLALETENKIYRLNERLNHLTEAKLKKSNQISIELMKQHILTEQLEQKQQELKKYQQLQEFVNDQSYCISFQENLSQKDYCLNQKQVVTFNQLLLKVSTQRYQNTNLKSKLLQLTSQLSALKSTHHNLTSLLKQVKSQHELRTQKMIVSNQILKMALEEKKHKYQEKLNTKRLDQPIEVRQFKCNDKKMFAQIDTNLCKKIEKPSMSQFSKGSPLTQLKSRLMAKFQASKAANRC